MASLAPLAPSRAGVGRCEARGEMLVARFRNAVFELGLQCLWSKRALTPSVHKESGVKNCGESVFLPVSL